MQRQSSEVFVNYSSCNRLTYLTVGNTGLFLIGNEQAPGCWQMHFTPEGNTHRIDEKAHQYAVTFMASLSALVEWLSQQDDFNLSRIFMATNACMASFIQRTLGPAVTVQYASDFEVGLQIDWGVLMIDAYTLGQLDSAYRQMQANEYWVD